MMKRLGTFFAVAVTLLGKPAADPSAFEKRVELLFRPPLGEQVALSPDGRRIAFTSSTGPELLVTILDLDRPLAKLTLNVDEGRVVAFAGERDRAQLQFLRWATSDRLVLAPSPERIAMLNGARVNAPIMAVDASGLNPMTLAEAASFTEMLTAEAGKPVGESGAPPPAYFIARQPTILGFLAGDREQLLLGVPRIIRPADMSEIPAETIAVNIRTGKQRLVERSEVKTGASDGRFNLSAAAQRELDHELGMKFPQRKIAVVDWTEDAAVVLARINGGNDPGRLFTYDRGANLVTEVLQTTPWLAGTLHDTRFVSAKATDGRTVSGYVTWPKEPRFKITPLLVCFPSAIPAPMQPEFEPEAQVFADFGYAVLRLNPRFQRPPNDRDQALLEKSPDLPYLEDGLVLLNALTTQFPRRPFDTKRVVSFGRSFGGYVAVRAAQERGDVFRAAIAIDAPMDLAAWLYPEDLGLAARPPRELPPLFSGHPERLAPFAVKAEVLTRPVLFVVEPAANAAIEHTVSQLRSRLAKLRQPADYLETEPGFRLKHPKARAAVYRRIEAFLNAQLYQFQVKIGPEREVK